MLHLLENHLLKDEKKDGKKKCFVFLLNRYLLFIKTMNLMPLVRNTITGYFLNSQIGQSKKPCWIQLSSFWSLKIKNITGLNLRKEQAVCSSGKVLASVRRLSEVFPVNSGSCTRPMLSEGVWVPSMWQCRVAEVLMWVLTAVVAPRGFQLRRGFEKQGGELSPLPSGVIFLLF